VFGVTLERAISKLARRMEVSKSSIGTSIRKLMAEGLVMFAGSRLFACHNKSGRCQARRRALVKKGTAIRHQLALEAVCREMYQDPEWVEGDEVPEPGQGCDAMAPEDLIEYRDWAASTIPPAGGWRDCDAQDASFESILRRRRATRFFIEWIREASDGSHIPAKPCGSVDDLVDAGLDANDVFVDPSADEFGENRFALVR
jgi:hypothetical protein